MLQFYLLSVLLNVLTGLVLFFSFGKEQLSGESQFGKAISIDDPALFENKSFRLALGLASGIVGILKLFVTAGGLVVFGDLLPALAGITGSFTLLLDYYISQASIEIALSRTMDTIFRKGAKYIGIACVTAGALHFIFPRAPLL